MVISKEVCTQILQKAWWFHNFFFPSKCDHFFENFPESSLDHVAWDFKKNKIRKMANFRHKKKEKRKKKKEKRKNSEIPTVPFSSRSFNEITQEASDSEPRKKLVKEDKIPCLNSRCQLISVISSSVLRTYKRSERPWSKAKARMS